MIEVNKINKLYRFNLLSESTKEKLCIKILKRENSLSKHQEVWRLYYFEGNYITLRVADGNNPISKEVIDLERYEFGLKFDNEDYLKIKDIKTQYKKIIAQGKIDSF